MQHTRALVICTGFPPPTPTPYTAFSSLTIIIIIIIKIIKFLLIKMQIQQPSAQRP